MGGETWEARKGARLGRRPLHNPRARLEWLYHVAAEVGDGCAGLRGVAGSTTLKIHIRPWKYSRHRYRGGTPSAFAAATAFVDCCNCVAGICSSCVAAGLPSTAAAGWHASPLRIE